MKYLIGIDLGTTNIKGVLFDENGNKIQSSSGEYQTYYLGEGFVEQDANEWWHAAVQILQEITSKVSYEVIENIAGICISSQTPTLLPVDLKGVPLRRAIIWMDSRAENELDYIVKKIGLERYVEITGMLPAVSFLPPKLMWFKEKEEAIFAKTSYILQASSFINYKLTGVFSMDKDQAALTQCLDNRKGSWSRDIEKIINIKFADLFPEPVDNGHIIGHVTEKAAEKTGLFQGIPVVAGTSDAIAAMYASGLSEMGEAVEVSGTSSLIFAGTHELPKDYHTVSAHRCSLKNIPYIYNVPITATGASIKWYLKNFGLYEELVEEETGVNIYDTLNQEASLSEPGANGLMFFPYMMGERAPLWNNYAKGMFIGLSMNTSRQDMIRAIFEGTAYALKSVLEEFKRNGTQINALRVVGGGAGSRSWLKIKASIVNTPIYILDDKTGDVPFGDAMIAGLAVGIYKDLTQSIKEIVKVKEIIHPDEEWVKIYSKRYRFFKEFYSDLDQSLKEYDKIINLK